MTPPKADKRMLQDPETFVMIGGMFTTGTANRQFYSGPSLNPIATRAGTDPNPIIKAGKRPTGSV
jgi:hypothetical protein